MRVEQPTEAAVYAAHFRRIQADRGWSDDQLLYFMSAWLRSPKDEVPDIYRYLAEVVDWQEPITPTS